MRNELISIVMPTYNSEKTIERTINSIINQTYENWELLIVDDASTDDTDLKVVEYLKDERIKFIKCKENYGGPAKPRNIGINNSRGEVIAFIDSDDWWSKDKLAISINHLQNYDFIYHPLQYYGSRGKINKRTPVRNLKVPVFKDLLLRNNAIPTSSVCVKKNIIEKVNGFSEDKALIAVEDYDCWLNISQKTEKFKCINTCLGYYWVGDYNISAPSISTITRTTEVFHRHMKLLSSEEKNKVESTMSFLIGRIYHKLGDVAKAKKLYRKAFSSMNYEMRIKSIILYFGLLIHR